MATITITIDDDELETIGRRLLGDPSADTPALTSALEAFVQVGANEYIQWILGRERYRSLSELQIDRVAAIYADITPDEAPTRTRLYNDYGLSHGQATYVARVLADRQLATWREKAIENLTEQINAKLKKAQENLGNERGEAELQITLTSLAVRELERLFQLAFAKDRFLAPWKRGTSVGDLHFIGVASVTVVALAIELGLIPPTEE